jgi:hypothetical protein
MYESTIKILDKKELSQRSVSLGMRVIAYGAIWVLAAVILEVIVPPGSPLNSPGTPVQQRIELLHYLPLMVVTGLTKVFPREFPYLMDVAWGWSACLAAIGVLTVTCRRLSSFVWMLCVHVAILSVGLIVFFATIP